MKKNKPISKANREQMLANVRNLLRSVATPDINTIGEIEKDAAPPVFPDPLAKQHVTIEVALAVKNAFKLLESLAADGDRSALDVFLGIVSDELNWLEGFAQRKPELVRKVARAAFAWPMRVNLRPARMREVRDFLERFEVGEDSDVDAKGLWGIAKSKGNPDKGLSTATRYALAMVDSIRKKRIMLPLSKKIVESDPELRGDWERVPQWAKDCLTVKPLTKDPDAWFEIGWQMLLAKTDGHPEDIPELHVIGQHRERHSEQYGQQRIATSGTRAANVRDGIRERIRQAMRRMARKRTAAR